MPSASSASAIAAQRAAEDVGHRDPAFGEALRSEEHLGAHDAVGMGAREVRAGDVVEVLFAHQHPAALEVEAQERRKVGERVRVAQRIR